MKSFGRCASALVFGAAALLPLYGQLVHAQRPPIREEMVAMRDGVRLATSAYLPTGTGPWPVVLSRTPYGKDQGDPAKSEAEYMAHGYARVLQDARGKFKSEGKYVPFANDIEDGYDTIEWIAKQPWSNGKVGMVGASALGIATYNAAMSGAPHLLAAFVTVARGYSRPTGGVPMQHLEAWSRRQGVPGADVPRPTFRNYDDAGARDLRAYVGKVNVPFYNVAGWYDIFLQGNIDGFNLLQTQGGPTARGNEKLMIGAFGHGNVSGDLKYPADAGRIGGLGDPIRWFDHWLKAIDNGIMKEPTVRYFVMGDTFDKSAPGNDWRTADNWPPRSTATSYYLASGAKLALTRPSVQDKASYAYDPNDPVATRGGNNLMLELGPMDQRPVSGRKDVLKFETDPLKQAVEVAGPVSAELVVSTDAQDTDFMVKLVDVYPNGYEALVQDGAFRLRYVNGFDKQTRIQPGTAYPITVDLWSTALVFNAGHKIAVHVSSSNFPRFERHSNTWEPLKNYEGAVKATNTVFLDGRSRIVLPVTTIYPARQVSSGR
jgi:predicted acyl esterase